MLILVCSDANSTAFGGRLTLFIEIPEGVVKKRQSPVFRSPEVSISGYGLKDLVTLHKLVDKVVLDR